METDAIVAALKQMIEAFDDMTSKLKFAQIYFEKLRNQNKLDERTIECLELDGFLTIKNVKAAGERHV